MDDFIVGPGYRIPASEIQWNFQPSSGPGGQHANKAGTAVDARLDVSAASGISPAVRARLLNNLEVELRVYVDSERSQARNRSIALERLAEIIEKALVIRKVRRPSKPTRGSQRRRVESKRQRGQTKRQRQRSSVDD